jgi:hypothetical protein
MDYWRFGNMASRRFRTSIGRDHSLSRRVQVPAMNDGLHGAHAAEDAVGDVGILPVLVHATNNRAFCVKEASPRRATQRISREQ